LNVSARGASRCVRVRDHRARITHLCEALKASGNTLVRDAGETISSRLQSCGRTIAF